ncbi:hypothetical protein SDC9_162142 [bioreactor metagenome]|uniref:Uncharacterized protein n=1 Tax=bioreactor metagenome TaxID=1076179 RepID=A0A645FRM6_9ZZZZ
MAPEIPRRAAEADDAGGGHVDGQIEADQDSAYGFGLRPADQQRQDDERQQQCRQNRETFAVGEIQSYADPFAAIVFVDEDPGIVRIDVDERGTLHVGRCLREYRFKLRSQSSKTAGIPILLP